MRFEPEIATTSRLNLLLKFALDVGQMIDTLNICTCLIELPLNCSKNLPVTNIMTFAFCFGMDAIISLVHFNMTLMIGNFRLT